MDRVQKGGPLTLGPCFVLALIIEALDLPLIATKQPYLTFLSLVPIVFSEP